MPRVYEGESFEALRELLTELFPFGLTEDAPCRHEDELALEEAA